MESNDKHLSFHLITQPLPGTDDQVNERIKEIADKINKYGYICPNELKELKNNPPCQVVTGPSHVAFLLADGTIARIPFVINYEKIDLNINAAAIEAKKKTTISTATSIALSHTLSTTSQSSSTATIPSSARVSGLNNNIPPTTTNNNATTTSNTSGGVNIVRLPNSGAVVVTASSSGAPRASISRRFPRIGMASSRSRGSGVIVGRAVVPASQVPEDLINQCQVVLQNRSRGQIIRELQKTNLDVNLAVNNLLSRDDGGDDEVGDEDYMQDDLISLLDAGIESSGVMFDSEVMLEDVLSYSSRPRSLSQREALLRAARDHPPRWHSDILARNLDSHLKASADKERTSILENDMNKRSTIKCSQTNNVSFVDELQYWTDKDGKRPVFTHIASLYSELLAINAQGQLCQWRWSDPEPFFSAAAPSLLHPKTAALQLASEIIIHLSSCIVRASIATTSGKVATLVDESISSATATARVEHTAIAWPEFEAGISEIHTSTLYTMVRLNNDNIFWWGVMPFELRKKIALKTRAKSTKKHSKGSCSEIVLGAAVCLRTAPFHNQGAIGYTIHNGVPKIGSLLECAWSLNDTCRFKVIRAGTPTADNTSNDKKKTNNSTHDKIDMPPPPSPASSTCSDHSGPTIMSPAYKRKRVGGSVTPVKEMLSSASLGACAGEEEDWPMSEVVMVEDARNMPIGRVLKVDGCFAAVKFPKDGESVAAPLRTNEDASALLSDCRLLKKDDLLVVRGPAPPRTPELIQRTPRKITFGDGELLGCCIDDTDISAVLKSNDNKLQLIIYNMSSGIVEQRSCLPSYLPALIKFQPSVKLYAASSAHQATWSLMLDGNYSIYPLSPDCLDSVREPNWPNLPPIRCLSIPTPAPGTPAVALFAIVLEQQLLMQHILRCDIEKVEKFFKNSSSEDCENAMKEMCDGGRNILHVIVSQSAPTSAKENDVETTTNISTETMRLNVESFTGPPIRASELAVRRTMREQMHGIREMMRQASSFSRSGSSFDAAYREFDNSNRIPSEDNATNMTNSSAPVEEFYELPRYDGSTITNTQKPIISTSTTQEDCWSLPPIKIDDKERHSQAILVLKSILSNSSFRAVAIDLLKAKDADGLTPLMRAVWLRSYKAGQLLLEYALSISNGNENLLMSMIFPSGSSPDLSPLYMLVANDTCSFTWTGAYHIQQDIFECKTCGLTGTLCCCTECARVCHRGHDCQIKSTAPTAYCDCWEKCPCKTLVSGSQQERMSLLTLLLRHSGKMVAELNSNGEHILYFLAATASRQQHEFRQYQRVIERSGTTSSQRQAIKEAAEHAHVDIGQEPPRFARRALEKVLGEWIAVRSLLLANKTDSDDEKFVEQQSGSTRLDRFTHLLLTKCGMEALTTLLDTLTRHIQSPITEIDANEAARRFIRSVARIFVVVSMETSPSSSGRKGIGSRAALANSMLSGSINKSRIVFKHLLPLAIEELGEVADSLISPVRLGVAKPTAPFSLLSTSLEAVYAADDLFSVDPLPYRHQNSSTDSRSQVSQQSSMLTTPLLATSMASQTLHDADSDNEEQANNLDSVNERLQGVNVENEAMDTELQLVESDSESECAPSGDEASVQQSAVTGATAGSEALAFFSDEEDEEDDTVVGAEDDDQSVPDDDQSQHDNEDHDDDSDATSFTNERPILHIPTTTSNRQTIAPITMQWAVANSPRPLPRRSSTFLDAANSSSMTTTVSQLSRAFGIVIRMMSDLLSDTIPRKESDGFPGLHLANEESIICLKQIVEKCIKPTWIWMKLIMDSTEAQLRYGCGLNNKTESTQQLLVTKNTKKGFTSALSVARMQALEVLERSPSRRSTGTSARFVLTPNASSNTSDTQYARRDFFTYALSLMRSKANEHMDSLPSLDVSALKHVAYVLDSIIYYIRNVGGLKCSQNILQDDIEQVDQAEGNATSRLDRFFQRSPSVMQIGCTPPDPFQEPVSNALPLAEQPHLLHPHARRDELFGSSTTQSLVAGDCDPISLSLSKQIKSKNVKYNDIILPTNHEGLVGRWRHSLHLFGRVFSDDVGAESGSIISELGGFPVKEAKFRRETERLRTNQQRDLIMDVCRNPHCDFFVSSIRQINLAYSRRVSSISSGSAPPLAVHKVKVTFKDEPGEGSGVARSFYTAFAHAALTLDPLPILDSPPNQVLSTSSNNTYPDIVTKMRQQQRRLSAPRPRRQRSLLSSADIASIAQSSPMAHDHEYEDRRQQLYRRVSLIHPSLANKITSLLMDLPTNCQLALLSNEEALRQRVEHAVEVLMAQESSRSMHDIMDLDMFNFSPSSMIVNNQQTKDDSVSIGTTVPFNDTASLFWQPGKRGYYAPRPGNNSNERLNAMRCIGRVIGLCLLQNELFPLHFCRHVLKYILYKQVAWHDLAFFDPSLYDSLRQMVLVAETEDGEKTLFDMSISMTAPADDCNNPTKENELFSGSQDILVNHENVYNYVKLYAQKRLVDNIHLELDNLYDGVRDVLPTSTLDGLTAEDLRLLLNGQGDICVATLQSYTSFTDESGESNSEKVAKFKKWFWAVVEKMSSVQKQDLVYFWTSSPALPASEDGFQPMPSITIRPPDDSHLPTANTCISRLYIPLYSARSILRNKLTAAIVTRTFGYV